MSFDEQNVHVLTSRVALIVQVIK